MMAETMYYIVNLLITFLLDFRFQLLVLFGLLVLFRLVTSLPQRIKEHGNKTVFITGCDTGMGHRMAQRLDELGMHVFAGCLKPEGSGASELKEACSNRLRILPLDITNDDQVREAVEYVEEHLPNGERGLYGLINNAGILCFADFDLMTPRVIEECIDTNLTGTLRVTKHFLPLLYHMPGRIVTVTSILARLVSPRTTVYAATKHGLDGFFSALRQEVEKKGIKISTIEPADFSACTDIMQYTRSHMDEIWDSLSTEEKESKRELYEAIMRKVSSRKCSEAEQEKQYEVLLSDVEDAMLAENPKWRYVSAPFATKMALAVLRYLPESITHKLMANMPS